MSDNLNLTLTLRATDQGLTGTVREARDGVGRLDDQLGKTSQSTRQFAKQTRDADKSTDGFAKRLAGGAIGAAQWALAIGGAATALTGYIVATNTDAIRQTDMFAQSLNMSTQTMTEWQYASEQMGLSGDGLQQVFQDVQDKLGDLTTTGGGEAVDLFENLNLKMDELITLSPDQQLLAIADAMDGINQNQKVFFMESLASDSTRLLPLLQDNAAELRRLQLEAQVLGVSISDIDAVKVTQAGQAMDRTKGLMGGLANEITIELAPVLTGVSNLLVDNAVEAGGFGDAVRTTVDGAVTGIGFVLDYGQQLLVWSKHAQIGMMTLGQYGTGAMASIADTTANVINTVLYPFQKYYSWLIDKFASLVELGVSLGGPFADEFDEASQWLKGLSQDVEQFKVEGSDIIALNEAMKNSLVTASEELDALLNANAPSEDLKNWVQKLREESEQAAQAQVDLRNKTGTTGDVVGSGVDVSPYEKLTAELESQLELVGLSAREQAIETQVRKLSAQATGEQKDAIRRLAGELFDAQEQQKQTQTTLETGLVTLTTLTEQAAERIDSAFAGAWANIDDGFDGLIDGIQSAFTQMLAEMAHEALTKPIILNIQQNMGSLLAPGGGASGSADLTGNIAALKFGDAGVSADAAGSAGISMASGAIAAGALVTVAAINAHNKADAERMKKYTAEYRQGVQSTGTVLGDINAKSHSVSELTAELVEMNTDVLSVNFDMLTSLRAIESGIAGVSNGVARQLTQAGGLEDYSGSLSTSKALDTVLGNSIVNIASGALNAAGLGIVGDFVGGLIGAVSKGIYSKKKSLQDAGIDFAEQTLGAVIDDGFVTADAYQRIKTTRRILGIKKSSSKKKTSDLDDSIQYQLGDVFSNAASVLASVAGDIDIASRLVDQSVEDYISSLSIDAGELSLKGLKGDELSAEIEAYISSNLDSWASQMLKAADLSGWVEQYQQAGEGVFQTLGRLTAQSRAFQETASQLNLQFAASGLESIELTQSLADLAGGFDQLQSQTAAYYQNYFSEAEQQAHLQQQLTAAFAEYNAELPKSKDEYRALVESLDLTSASGQQAYTRLMQLQGSFSDYADGLQKAAEAADQAAEAERRRQRDLLTTAFGQLSQAIDAELEALGSAWSDRQQALNDEIQAVSQSTSAIQTFIDALSNTLSQLQATTQQDFIDAQQQAFDWLNQSQVTWTDPGNYQDVLGHLGNINADWYASAVDYERDKKITANALADAKALASSQLSVEDQTLQTLQNTLTLEERAYDQSVSALEATREFWQQEIDAINGVDDAVLSVEDAIQKLKDVLQGAWESLGVTNEEIRWWLQQNGTSQLTIDDIVSAMQQAGVTGSQVADALDLTPTDNLSTTEQSIRQWLNANPNASDDEVASAMRIWGVSVERLAEMLNMTVTEVQQRYVATVPEQVLDKAHLPTSAGLSDTDVETWLNQNGGATLDQVADAMREFGVTLEQMARVSGWSLEAVEAAYLGLADGQGRTPDQLYVDGRQEQPVSQPAVPVPAPTIRYPQDGGVSDAEVQAWLAQNSGATLAQIADAMDAFGVTVQQMARVTGWSVSDVQSAYQIHGSHANGLDEVPFDNYLAFLHKGEMVVPAQQSDYLRTAETSKQFKALAEEMAAMRADNKVVLAQISKHTKDSANTAKVLSRTGQPVYIMGSL